MVFQHERDYQRLDYQLLQEGATNLYLNNEILADDISWLEANGYRIDSFDCSAWNDERAMHNDFARKLAFPSYYGKNLNALIDCLYDIEISDEGGRVLVFNHFEVFNTKFPRVAWDVLDIIEDSSRFYLLNGKRLLALVQSGNQSISFTNLGCHSPRLSPRER